MPTLADLYAAGKQRLVRVGDQYIRGPLEAAATIGSGMIAQPVSGIAGLLALPAGADAAANAVRRTQERMTYTPRSEAGRGAVEAVGAALQPLADLYERAQQVSGDAGYRMAGPAGGAIGAALPDALMAGLPLRPRNALIPRQLHPETGAIVFHGSPHKFDRFDMSKIGTGEGAQAYGHGLYFAESPSVAKTYKATAPYVGRHVQQIGLAALNRADGDVAKARQILHEQYTANADPYLRQSFADAVNNIQDIAKGAVGGNLYRVDLPDDQIARMLDWDKPLSQQPHILAAIEKSGLTRGFDPSKTGEELYRSLSTLNPKGGTEIMSRIGIPGIRYLDGGSRGAGQGTSNFVVFDDQIPKIIGRE